MACGRAFLNGPRGAIKLHISFDGQIAEICVRAGGPAADEDGRGAAFACGLTATDQEGATDLNRLVHSGGISGDIFWLITVVARRLIRAVQKARVAAAGPRRCS